MDGFDARVDGFVFAVKPDRGKDSGFLGSQTGDGIQVVIDNGAIRGKKIKDCGFDLAAMNKNKPGIEQVEKPRFDEFGFLERPKPFGKNSQPMTGFQIG